MQKLQAVFWDLDGVQVLSEELHERKVRVTAQAHGVTVTDAMWKSWHGIGDHRIHQELQKINPAFPPLENFLQECEDYYVAHAHELQARPGAIEAFNIFAAAGIPQAAVSSGVKRQVETNLQIAGIHDRVVFALNAGDVINTKPHPEPYNTGHGRMLTMCFNGNAGMFLPENCLVIEDSGSGIKSGHGAKMTTILWKLTAGPDNALATHNLDPEARHLISLARHLTSRHP
ncbi:MAG: family phosphatase [Micavibrio sp.]|nr:family phosphatase [Micavibrio sp.]